MQMKASYIQGNERDFYDEGGTHTASTVEMASLNQDYEVAVIDEAQLIGDQSRGTIFSTQLRHIEVCHVILIDPRMGVDASNSWDPCWRITLVRKRYHVTHHNGASASYRR